MIDAAIIGGGPAGIAAALRLKARGVPRVVILERAAALGGVPRFSVQRVFGLREFGRLLTGPAYAERLAASAQAAGVEILPGHDVTALRPNGALDVLTPDGPRLFAARRVLLATGARECEPAAGAGLGGVLNMSALQALLAAQAPPPFRRPVVVGAEMVPLSVLSLCRRHGIRPVAVLGERPRLNAGFILYPRLVRVPLIRGATVERIDGTSQVERVQLSNGAGLDCDGVLFAGEFLPEARLVAASHLRFDAGSGGPAMDQYGRCSDTSYFAAGKLAGAAGSCFRNGAAIGDYIADDLSGGLPSLEGRLEVLAGENIRFVVPQSLAHVAPLRGRLELRATGAVKGQLRVRAGEAVLYRRRVHAQAEQRLVINLDGLKTPPDDALLTVEIVP
ncbi:MAG: FAD-dependent oxidoreductase [Rhodospirillales bacterium]|nr:FAD-dependent oxidoreductase [Rhodospirillales bacterium]